VGSREISGEWEDVNSESALLVFVKYPEPGRVKTRLSPELTPQESAAFYRALAEEIVGAHASASGYDSIVCFDPGDAGREMRAWLGPNVRLWGQRGDDLGARELHALLKALEGGYKKVALIGTDCPTLAPGDIEAAFASLDRNDLVLGPCEDGGYYLIGVTRPLACLFEGVGWGGDRVLSETLERAEHAGLSLELLGSKYDIDSYADLERYYLETGDGTGDRPKPQSWRVLDGIMKGRG